MPNLAQPIQAAGVLLIYGRVPAVSSRSSAIFFSHRPALLSSVRHSCYFSAADESKTRRARTAGRVLSLERGGAGGRRRPHASSTAAAPAWRRGAWRGAAGRRAVERRGNLALTLVAVGEPSRGRSRLASVSPVHLARPNRTKIAESPSPRSAAPRQRLEPPQRLFRLPHGPSPAGYGREWLKGWSARTPRAGTGKYQARLAALLGLARQHGGLAYPRRDEF